MRVHEDRTRHAHLFPVDVVSIMYIYYDINIRQSMEKKTKPTLVFSGTRDVVHVGAYHTGIPALRVFVC